jgi:hypothetical protein
MMALVITYLLIAQGMIAAAEEKTNILSSVDHQTKEWICSEKKRINKMIAKQSKDTGYNWDNSGPDLRLRGQNRLSWQQNPLILHYRLESTARTLLYEQGDNLDVSSEKAILLDLLDELKELREDFFSASMLAIATGRKKITFRTHISGSAGTIVVNDYSQNDSEWSLHRGIYNKCIRILHYPPHQAANKIAEFFLQKKNQ